MPVHRRLWFVTLVYLLDCGELAFSPILDLAVLAKL